MTTVADGLFQYGGVPVNTSLLTSKIFNRGDRTQKKGRAWFVDTASGTSGNGRSPATAFSTMDKAFDSLHSGDIIFFVGKVTEQLVTPAQIFDVTVVGCGNRPRHADATPAGGNWAASQWGPPASGAVAGQATVRVLQQGWRFLNILWTAQGATAACIELVRNAGAGDAERDASHAHVAGCRFSGAGIGVRFGVAALFTEIVSNALIEDNDFNDMTTAISGAILATRAKIIGNRFKANTNHIVAMLENSLIKGNTMETFTTQSIDLNGGTGLNVIYNNYLSGTFSEGGGYRKANANDDWGGNWNTGVGILTAADPA